MDIDFWIGTGTRFGTGTRTRFWTTLRTGTRFWTRFGTGTIDGIVTDILFEDGREDRDGDIGETVPRSLRGEEGGVVKGGSSAIFGVGVSCGVRIRWVREDWRVGEVEFKAEFTREFKVEFKVVVEAEAVAMWGVVEGENVRGVRGDKA